MMNHRIHVIVNKPKYVILFIVSSSIIIHIPLLNGWLTSPMFPGLFFYHYGKLTVFHSQIIYTCTSSIIFAWPEYLAGSSIPLNPARSAIRDAIRLDNWSLNSEDTWDLPLTFGLPSGKHIQKALENGPLVGGPGPPL